MNDEKIPPKKSPSKQAREALQRKKILAQKRSFQPSQFKKRISNPAENQSINPARKSQTSKQSTNQDKPASHLPNSIQSRLQTKRDLRTIYTRSDTISKLSYRKINERMRFRFWVNVLMLMAVTVGIMGAFYFYLVDQHEKREILSLATKGLSALENNDTLMAQAYFDQALEKFIPFHPNPSVNQWNANANLYSVIFKVAEGYRSVGQYDQAIDTLEALAKRNIYNNRRLMAEKLQYHLSDIILSSRWNDETISQIYQNLINRLPTTWGPSAYYQSWATELAGLRVVTMSERYKQADLVVYGLPNFFDQNQRTLKIDGIRYYKMDYPSGEVTMRLPPGLTDTQRTRIAWYVEAGHECLIFGLFIEEGIQLLGLEGIVLSDHHTVEPFNELVLEHES